MTKLLDHFKNRETQDTNLISASIIGKPGSGKTTTINDICFGIKETNPGQKCVFLYTKDFNHVKHIHEHGYKEQVEKADMVIVFLDDAVTSMHSKDGLGKIAKQNEKFFYLIRHYFNENFKKKRRTLIIFFATQRYMALANIARSSDILFWKISNIREISEKKMVVNLMGKEGFRLISSLNKAMSQMYNPELLGNTVYRVMGNRARWLKTSHDRQDINWITLKKSDVKEKVKFTKDQKIEILRRAKVKKLKWENARFIAGCSASLVSEIYNQ